MLCRTNESMSREEKEEVEEEVVVAACEKRGRKLDKRGTLRGGMATFLSCCRGAQGCAIVEKGSAEAQRTRCRHCEARQALALRHASILPAVPNALSPACSLSLSCCPRAHVCSLCYGVYQCLLRS